MISTISLAAHFFLSAENRFLVLFKCISCFPTCASWVCSLADDPEARAIASTVEAVRWLLAFRSHLQNSPLQWTLLVFTLAGGRRGGGLGTLWNTTSRWNLWCALTAVTTKGKRGFYVVSLHGSAQGGDKYHLQLWVRFDRLTAQEGSSVVDWWDAFIS